MEKARKTIVIGHKNPDTDSICSAICYARFKSLTSEGEYMPARAGNLNPETRFVLDHFGVPEPDLVTNVKTQVKDIFGFEMITQNKFTTAQIDKNTWTESMLDMLMEFIRTDERGEPYRMLDWSKEYDLARNGDPNDTQSAL